MSESLRPINWSEDSYEITDEISMELTSGTGLERNEVIKLVAREFERHTDFDHYVYCFEYEDSGRCWYVGETENLGDRISTHSRNKTMTNLVTVEGLHGERSEALEREREMSYEVAIDKGSTDIFGGR